MNPEFEGIELEIDSKYYQAIKSLAQKENLSAEGYLSMMIEGYLEKHGIKSNCKTEG